MVQTLNGLAPLPPPPHALMQVFPFVEEAAENHEFVTSLLEAYLPVTILLIIINLLYFALKVSLVRSRNGCRVFSGRVDRSVQGARGFAEKAPLPPPPQILDFSVF